MAEGVYSRREAQSGRIDYCTPFILSETSRTKLTAIPFFIQHSDHSEQRVKQVHLITGLRLKKKQSR